MNLRQLAEAWGLDITSARHALIQSGGMDLCQRKGKSLNIPRAAIQKAEVWRKEHARKPVPPPVDPVSANLKTLDDTMMAVGHDCVARMRQAGATEAAVYSWCEDYKGMCCDLKEKAAAVHVQYGQPIKDAETMDADQWLDLYRRSMLHVMSAPESDETEREGARRFLQEFSEDQQREWAEATRQQILAMGRPTEEIATGHLPPR